MTTESKTPTPTPRIKNPFVEFFSLYFSEIIILGAVFCFMRWPASLVFSLTYLVIRSVRQLLKDTKLSTIETIKSEREELLQLRTEIENLQAELAKYKK